MARVTVRLPALLRALAGGATEVSVDGATVEEAAHRLAVAHPGLRPRLLAPDGRLRGSVAVYLNNEDVRAGNGGETRLHDGDVLEVLPALAGGWEGVAPADGPALGRDELVRYSRHLLLPEVGIAGQKRLRAAKVLVVGAGGLGAPAALYLAAAGVGELGLVDFDRVDMTNLQRQVLYTTGDLGRPKLDAARDRLRELNPDVRVTAHPVRLTAENALETIRPYDVVLDGTDNFPTRYLTNDACVLLGKPDVYGSIYRFEGQASVFDARHGPCYRCLYPEPPPPDLVPSCAEAGVFGVLPGLVGIVQATETIKLLVGIGEPLIGRLLLFDAQAMAFRELRLRKNPGCVLCSAGATQHGLVDYATFCGIDPDGAATDRGVPGVSATALRAELDSSDPPTLIDVREPPEWEIVRLPGATLLPRSQFGERVSELTHARRVVLYCSTGARSAQAVRLLLDLGFENVRSLEGGLRAWARDVDPELPAY